MPHGCYYLVCTRPCTRHPCPGSNLCQTLLGCAMLASAGPFLVLLLTSKTHSRPGQRGSEVQLVSRALGCWDSSEGTLCYGESVALPGEQSSLPSTGHNLLPVSCPSSLVFFICPHVFSLWLLLAPISSRFCFLRLPCWWFISSGRAASALGPA